jgi:hypothetical protein
MSDTAITQLRLLDEGLDMTGFAARFGRAFDDVYAKAVATAAGLATPPAPRRPPVADGSAGGSLSNQVFYRFV